MHLDNSSRIIFVGDSITAGRGSSDCSFDGDLILRLDGRPYFRQTGKKCYASLVAAHVEEKFPGITVINNGCNGLNSNHICKYAPQLFSLEDSVVFLMIGANNRKLTMGMSLLYHDLFRLIRYLRRSDTQIVLLSEVPSTAANESRKNRRYHMPQVHEVVQRVAEETGVLFIDVYDRLLAYLNDNQLTVDELMVPEEEIAGYGLPDDYEDYSVEDWNRLPDGLHPPDSVHKMIADIILEAFPEL